MFREPEKEKDQLQLLIERVRSYSFRDIAFRKVKSGWLKWSAFPFGLLFHYPTEKHDNNTKFIISIDSKLSYMILFSAPASNSTTQRKMFSVRRKWSPMMSMHLSSQIDLSEIMYKSLRWKCSDAKLMLDCKFLFPSDQHTDKHLPTYIQKQ